MRYLLAVLLSLGGAGALDIGLAQEAPQPIPEADSSAPVDTSADTGAPATSEPKKNQEGWNSLLPGKALEGWEITDYGGDGTAERSGDSLVFDNGDPLAGITYTKSDFPTSNYEIAVEAKRIEGTDFFVGLTFPVGKEFCSLIVGGWGGGMIGISSINGFDASENETGNYQDFENNRWYKVVLAVTDESIKASIDGKTVVNIDREHNSFSTRIEVYANQPLGYSVFRSKVAVRNFMWRSLDKEPAKDSEAGKASTASAPALQE